LQTLGLPNKMIWIQGNKVISKKVDRGQWIEDSNVVAKIALGGRNEKHSEDIY